MEDDYVICPYNKAHRMLRKRLIPHMIRCKTSSFCSMVDLKACPFNQAHMIPESEFVKHTTTCPDRKLISQYKYNEYVKKDEDSDKPLQRKIHCEENWDDDIVEDFDPKKNVRLNNILKQPDFLLRSDKKLQLKKEESNFIDEREFAGKKKNNLVEFEQNYKNTSKIDGSLKFNFKERKSNRLLTPPPPIGIDWNIKPSTLKRERSRSPN